MMTPYQKQWALNNKDKINNNQKNGVKIIKNIIENICVNI